MLGWGYETLTGPDGFRCRLTERENRSFFCDLEPVVDELNRLREENAKLRRECADIAAAKYREFMGGCDPIGEAVLRDAIIGK